MSLLKRKLVHYLQELARYGSKRIFPVRHLSFNGGTEPRMDLRPIEPSSNLLNKEVYRNAVNKLRTRFIHVEMGLARRNNYLATKCLLHPKHTRCILNKHQTIKNNEQYLWWWYDDRNLRYGIKSQGETNTF
jgi:hypothetical protein